MAVQMLLRQCDSSKPIKTATNVLLSELKSYKMNSVQSFVNPMLHLNLISAERKDYA